MIRYKKCYRSVLDCAENEVSAKAKNLIIDAIWACGCLCGRLCALTRSCDQRGQAVIAGQHVHDTRPRHTPVCLPM